MKKRINDEPKRKPTYKRVYEIKFIQDGIEKNLTKSAYSKAEFLHWFNENIKYVKEILLGKMKSRNLTQLTLFNNDNNKT